MVFFGKKLINFFFDIMLKKRIRDLIIFTSKRKKKKINFYEINYTSSQIRDIKITIIRYYLHKININKSYKEHLFNYLYRHEPIFHRKSCLIKYLLDKKFKIDKISASFLIKSDIPLFSKFNLKIKKIKPIKINILFSIISLLIFRITHQRKKVKMKVEKKSNFNSKIKYYNMLRTKDKNEQFIDLYKYRLGKSLDNTIICISPYSKRKYAPRGSKYLKPLQTIRKNVFYYNPRMNFYDILKKAIRIYLTCSLPHELKIQILQIYIQRIGIDDFINCIKKNFTHIREFYTGHEFYEGLVYLTEKLRELNIKIIIFEIGIGMSLSPIINSDLFYVFSKLQKNLFYGTSKFKYYKLNLPLKRNIDYSKKKFALFFICEVFEKTPTPRYNSTYKEVINYIEQIARDYEFPVYAKYHPISTAHDKIFSKKIEIVEKIEDLPQEYYYLSTLMVSTYALELLNLMPFLIINPQNTFNLKYAFPDDDLIYVNSYQEFREKIERFKQKIDYYNKYWEDLINLIKKYYFFESKL